MNKLPTYTEYCEMSPQDKTRIPRAIELAMFADPAFVKDEQKARHEEIAEQTDNAAAERAEIVAAGK